jgi:predicted membrane protein
MIVAILVLIAYLMIVALLLWAPKVRTRALRIASRIFGVIVLLPLLFVVPVTFFGFLLASGNPPAQYRVVSSAHGQEATLIYQAGFLGRDFTEVKVKRTECCQHVRVFSHSGPSGFDDPQIEWLDDRHLRVKYHTRVNDRQHCERMVGEIQVDCVGSSWPN